MPHARNSPALRWQCCHSFRPTKLTSTFLTRRYTTAFPSEKLGSLTRLAEFGSVWLLFFSVVMLAGTFAKAHWASVFLQAIVFFIAFLVNVVAAGAFSQRDRLYGFNSGVDAGASGVSSNFKALLAFLWLNTFFSLALSVYTFFKHTSISDEERAERLKKEHGGA